MKKILLTIVIIVIVLIGGWYLVKDANNVTYSTPLHGTYTIDGEPFTLVDGWAEKEITSDSATKDKLFILGDPVLADIDKDGDDDALVILINQPGGSGSFYYAAVSLNNKDKYESTNSILLGDRISIQDFYIEDSKAKIRYLDRAEDESFATKPSIEKEIHLTLDKDLNLVQVAKDFEGEADPNIMTLDMKTWQWIETVYNNDTKLMPNNPGDFSLNFKKDNTFSAETDCNAMSGKYEVLDNKISFKEVIATEMFCENSQELEFSSMLNEVQSFLFTSKGELILELKLDTGSSIFK